MSYHWNNLVSENGLLRAKISKEIKTVHESYYDDLILKIVPKESMKIVRVVGEIIGLDKPCLSKWFIVWRIKELEAMGCVEIENKYSDKYMFNNIRKIV
ncbi:hypothetical protein DP143_11310 [Clostridium tetani]|nr:hypothetical protein DP143_11310 [Clostridium tetani]